MTEAEHIVRIKSLLPTTLGSAEIRERIAADIPVRFTNEQGQTEGAMYDRVSGQLYRNAGTGAFGYGNDK